MKKEELWSKAFIYDGDSILELVDTTARLIKVLDCKESTIYIDEYSEIVNGICEFKYQIYNYDISQDILYMKGIVSFMTLFDFIKDNNLSPLGVPVKEYIIDRTHECLEYYILHQRKTNNY